jgi:small subunit ribosomal protein S17
MPKRILKGKVISTKTKKTIKVLIERWKVHPKYKKRFKIHKKVLAHDEKEKAKVGDIVAIQESRPISKTKKWRLIKIIEKAEKE